MLFCNNNLLLNFVSCVFYYIVVHQTKPRFTIFHVLTIRLLYLVFCNVDEVLLSHINATFVSEGEPFPEQQLRDKS